MNTKVEEALALLDAEIAECGRLDPWSCEDCARIKEARTTLAAHIAQQDATIARLTAALATIRDSTFRNATTLRGMADYTLNQEQGK